MIHVIACPHYFSPGIFGCLKNYLPKVYCTRDFILRHATFEFNTIENILIHTKRKTTATWAGPIVVCMCVIATIRQKRRWMGFSTLAGILFFPPATKPILLDWRRDGWCSWYGLLWKPVFSRVFPLRNVVFSIRIDTESRILWLLCSESTDIH